MLMELTRSLKRTLNILHLNWTLKTNDVINIANMLVLGS